MDKDKQTRNIKSKRDGIKTGKAHKQTALTEEMIVTRSKQPDLSQIKKFNCWGSNLSDISIIKKMTGVEVLALSVNKISSLKPFQECRKLQELYLRRNNIKDISEIGHLKQLPALRYLSLAENPCCDEFGANYRAIILRTLPHLKKLDNVDVSPEEVRHAQRSTFVYDCSEELQNQQSMGPSPTTGIKSPNLVEQTIQPSTQQSLRHQTSPIQLSQKANSIIGSNARRSSGRTPNLLSAALCLINELDYTSLEVVENAVRCRISDLLAD